MRQPHIDDVVRLNQDIPELELQRGQTGVVRSTWFAPTVAYEVEFDATGEAKRALLALGLLTPQPLLLLDEPFDGLDFRQTRDVMTLLRAVPARGRTLFVSIHQLVDASRMCDRLVLLSRGRVAGVGTLDELRAQAGLAQREAGLEEVFLALT